LVDEVKLPTDARRALEQAGADRKRQKLRLSALKPRSPSRCGNWSRVSGSAFVTLATFWAFRASASSN
jgi:hypothetical protein